MFNAFSIDSRQASLKGRWLHRFFCQIPEFEFSVHYEKMKFPNPMCTQSCMQQFYLVLISQRMMCIHKPMDGVNHKGMNIQAPDFGLPWNCS